MPIRKAGTEPITGIPDCPVCGIYSLSDSSGKRYIGSSQDIRQRVLSHKYNMNAFLREGENGFLNPAMKEAIISGEVFRCEVLASFNCAMERSELREIERLFINKFGGYENTYNYSVILHKV